MAPVDVANARAQKPRRLARALSSSKRRGSRIAARHADDELLITRTFDAPASTVFALWSDAEPMKHWMGPEGFTCPDVEMDFRVGDAYRAMIESQEYGESWFGGVYREIVRDKRLPQR
jgi:uncharacterized protein YndB with AHSA1/START domain